MTADEPGRSRARVAWWLVRLLGFVHLTAFASLAVQADGLFGEAGLIPLHATIDWVGANDVGWARFPSLLRLAPTDGALHAFLGAGMALSLLAIAGVAPRAVLAALWALYLSLVVAGSPFLSFQWDVLLLEATLVALFLAPAGWRPRRPDPARDGRGWGIPLMRLLVFKLMFLSGATKLLSGDPVWRDLTALEFHYWTQPLPAWTAWYVDRLPDWIHRASCAGMYAIELGAPLLIPFGRRARAVACAALVLLQLGIAATGNYGFFNLLSIALCLALLDDGHLARLRMRPGRAPAPWIPAAWRRARIARRVAVATAAGALAALSLLAFAAGLVHTARPRSEALAWARPALASIAPFRSVNGYGLFRTMTTTRPELTLEASDDGRTWVEVPFRWKPGDPARRPRFTGPHMPRLDWQMWFAALHPPAQRVWLESLMYHVLHGNPDVIGLLDAPELVERPPRYLRIARWEYRFAPPGTASGAWWTRERLGAGGVVSRDRFRDG